ncbi:MAG: RNA polymerase sigma-70 factor [Odoribacteraceae bacterium]|jgi:RNA polymerase sigma-70 factor (ECF subfamily)|nr:RNA polymerase sigma-70 factor [Odoribacteraceae bacterium]
MEEQLFDRLRQGDWEAFRLVFERHVERLYLYAMGFVKRREDAEDIVQEVFVGLWEGRHRVSRVVSARAYLSRSVKNACIDFQLHARVERRYREEVAALRRGTDSEADDPEAIYRRLHAALATLPPKCLEVFILGCVDGMSYKEIAEAAGISVNTVKTQVKIAYKRMREELGDDGAAFLLLVALLSSCPSPFPACQNPRLHPCSRDVACHVSGIAMTIAVPVPET